MAKLSDRATQVRLVRFLVVGGVSAIVQFLVLWILQHQWTPALAFSTAFGCATGTHYFLNRFWALPSARQDSARQLGEYLLTVALSYGINLGVFKIARDILGLSVMWAAVCAVPPATLVVFLVLNHRVFRAKAGGGAGRN